MTFQDDIQRFREENERLLSRGKALFAALDDERSSKYIQKPFMLKIILEKYLEIIEDKLLPALPVHQKPVMETQPEVEDVVQSSKPNEEVPKIENPIVEESLKSKSQPNLEEDTGSFHVCTPHLVENFRSAPARSKAASKQATNKAVHGKAQQVQAKPVVKKSPHDDAFKEEATKHGPDPRTLIHALPGSRRHIPRYSCRMSLSYSVVGKDAKPHKAFSKDVGALGLFIMANRPEKAGDQIQIEIELPEVGRATINAVVAWTKWVPQNLRTIEFPGFGVKITNASENWYSYFMNAS